jgi:hypothetical protein
LSEFYGKETFTENWAFIDICGPGGTMIFSRDP